MNQRDYILRITESIARALAQILFHKEIKDYQGAHAFIDEQFKRTVGMGSGFIHSVPEDTLLSLLTTLGTLNVDKVYLIATLLKAEGDIYVEQGSSDEAYFSYLKSLHLFLEVLLLNKNLHNEGRIPEVEELLANLEEYEIPPATKQLLSRYQVQSGEYYNLRQEL